MSTGNPLTAPHCFFKRKSLQEPEISVPILIVTINAFLPMILQILSSFIFSPGVWNQSFVVTLLLKMILDNFINIVLPTLFHPLFLVLVCVLFFRCTKTKKEVSNLKLFEILSYGFLPLIFYRIFYSLSVWMIPSLFLHTFMEHPELVVRIATIISEVGWLFCAWSCTIFITGLKELSGISMRKCALFISLITLFYEIYANLVSFFLFPEMYIPSFIYPAGLWFRGGIL